MKIEVTAGTYKLVAVKDRKKRKWTVREYAGEYSGEYPRTLYSATSAELSQALEEIVRKA